MTESPRPVPRVLVAAVTAGRGRATDEAAKSAAEEVRNANFILVRSVVVRGEPEYIRQLVSHVSNGNEADAIIMLGGAGIGPRDLTCDALDSFFERHVEGFGHAYRQLLRDEFNVGPMALLARASAGIYNRCLVYALPIHLAQMRRAIQTLILPTLSEAVDLATGRGMHAPRPSDPPASVP
jgi:molybdenum cofactor biosynthesis protein B